MSHFATLPAAVLAGFAFGRPALQTSKQGSPVNAQALRNSRHSDDVQQWQQPRVQKGRVVPHAGSGSKSEAPESVPIQRKYRLWEGDQGIMNAPKRLEGETHTLNAHDDAQQHERVHGHVHHAGPAIIQHSVVQSICHSATGDVILQRGSRVVQQRYKEDVHAYVQNEH
jgi:hypothetical protein